MYISYLRNLSNLSIKEYFEQIDKKRLHSKFKKTKVNFEIKSDNDKVNIIFYREAAPYPLCTIEIKELSSTNLLEVRIFPYISNYKFIKLLYGKLVRHLVDIHYVNNFLLLLQLIKKLSNLQESENEFKHIGILSYHLIYFAKRSKKTILAKFGRQLSIKEFLNEVEEISIYKKLEKRKYLPYVISFSINNRLFAVLSAKRGLFYINEKSKLREEFKEIIRNEVIRLEINTLKERIVTPRYIKDHLYTRSFVHEIENPEEYHEIVNDINIIAESFKSYGTKKTSSIIGNPITRIYLEDKEKALDLVTIIKDEDSVRIIATPMNILRDYISTFTYDVITILKTINIVRENV